MHTSNSILVVDDDADTRRLVALALHTHRYTITEASDGLMAFRYARHTPPALIVMDLGLPGQDGCDLARQIRSDPLLETVPILAMTGYSATAILAAARAAGCYHIIHKPFGLQEIQLAASELLAASTQSWHRAAVT